MINVEARIACNVAFQVPGDMKDGYREINRRINEYLIRAGYDDVHILVSHTENSVEPDDDEPFDFPF
jgi:hypothetical protein